MGLIYTKKKDDIKKDEQTMNATEFIERMVSSQRVPDKQRKEDYTASPPCPSPERGEECIADFFKHD